MRTEIIAELASNHGGDLALAQDLISACADAGADWVKVQAYTASTLRRDDPQRDWLTQAELSETALETLQAHAERVGVGFLVSAFDIHRARFVRNALGHDTIKVGSGEVKRAPFMAALADLFPRVLLGQGLWHTPDVIEDFERKRVTVVPMYGVSEYPTCHDRAMSALASRPRGAVWGWSDHTQTRGVGEVAIQCGAVFLEKHVTSADGRGRVSSWDVRPNAFRDLRACADAAAWHGTAAHAAACQTYAARWTDGDAGL